MAKLKAWVRFDSKKNVVPGSLILRENKPTVGIWKEITYNLCCDGGITPNIPTAPLYIYDFEITCSDFCLNSIDVNGEPYPFPICETPLDFIGLVNLLQTTFPDDIINGIPATPPNEGGTITMISSKRVFGTIVTENCGSITPVISGLGALRFGFLKTSEGQFIKFYTEVFKKLGLTNTNASTVEAWNEYFDLPANGIPFTNMYITQQVISEGKLPTYSTELIFIGGGNMTLNTIIQSQSTLYYILDDGGFVNTVNNNAFQNFITLEQVNLPACTLIKSYAFAGSKLSIGFNCPNLIEIEESGLERSGVEYLYFPLATDIGKSAFSECPLSVINISSAINIGDLAFFRCGKLTSLDMSSVINLGQTYTCADNQQNNVFAGINFGVIVVKVPLALTTCNSGDFQIDLKKLIDENTVTLITT